MKKTAAVRKSIAAATSVAGAFTVGAVVALRFDMLAATPGANRLQEHTAEGTPLVNDAEGVKVGALYLRKAAFGEMPVGAQFEVSIKRIK